jgi:mRNA interferase MazF
MMNYKRGDIVLVNFNPQKKPEEVAKVRPAIIISDSELNLVLDLVSVVAMSTNLIDNAEPLRIRVKKRDRLEKDSDAMIEQLRSVSKRRIGEKIATLSQEEMSKIEYGIKEMLGLS